VPVYLVAASYWFRLNAEQREESTPGNWMFWGDVFCAPAALLWLLVLGPVLPPFWWLYPERHAHVHDFEGTLEQQAELRRWRGSLFGSACVKSSAGQPDLCRTSNSSSLM